MKPGLRAALTGLLLALVACGDTSPDAGGGDGPGDRFEEVAGGLGRIESAHVELSLKSLKPDTPPRGFEMSGVFAAAASAEELPLADLTYRNLLPSVTRKSAFVSDGSRAWAVTDRGVTELKDEKLEPLKGGEDPAGIRGLALGKWFSGSPTEEAGETLDGVETVAFSGPIDAATVLNDIIAMTGNLRANVPAPLQGDALDLVGEAMQSPQLTIVAGEDDDLVRRISFSTGLPPNRDDLRDTLERLYGERIEFQLDLTQVNRPVTPPAAPQGPAAPTTTTATVPATAETPA